MGNPKNSEKGAASVLIIFMMVVLITLGAFAIASANANYRLSARAADWNEMYYRLDAAGAVFLAAVDGVLAEAEQTARAIQAGTEQTDDAQMLMLSKSNTPAVAFDYLFLYDADRKVRGLMEAYPGMTVTAWPDSDAPEALWISIRMVSDLPEQAHCGLQVTLRVRPPVDGSRYVVEEWFEYQETAEAEAPTQSWWDGVLE